MYISHLGLVNHKRSLHPDYSYNLEVCGYVCVFDVPIHNDVDNLMRLNWFETRDILKCGIYTHGEQLGCYHGKRSGGNLAQI